LFVLGVLMDDPLAFLRSLAQIALGVLYFQARAVGFEAGRVTSVTYEYGNAFTTHWAHGHA
jgi:hypothetical protein